MYGAAALVPGVRPLNTYKLTKELREIITRTRNILQIKGQIDTKDPDDPYRSEKIVRLKKEAIYLVAKKIASVLGNQPGAGANYLNTPILHYLRQMHADITMKHQSNRYQRSEYLENEFNLENGNNSNAGGIELEDVFDRDDESDEEILAIVDEFNNQPRRSRSRTRSRNRNRSINRNKSRSRNRI